MLCECAGAGESVSDADLVAWVMVGLQHVPRSEDVPLIQNMFTNFFIKASCQVLA